MSPVYTIKVQEKLLSVTDQLRHPGLEDIARGPCSPPCVMCFAIIAVQR